MEWKIASPTATTKVLSSETWKEQCWDLYLAVLLVAKSVQAEEQQLEEASVLEPRSEVELALYLAPYLVHHLVNWRVHRWEQEW